MGPSNNSSSSDEVIPPRVDEIVGVNPRVSPIILEVCMEESGHWVVVWASGDGG